MEGGACAVSCAFELAAGHSADGCYARKRGCRLACRRCAASALGKYQPAKPEADAACASVCRCRRHRAAARRAAWRAADRQLLGDLVRAVRRGDAGARPARGPAKRLASALLPLSADREGAPLCASSTRSTTCATCPVAVDRPGAWRVRRHRRACRRRCSMTPMAARSDASSASQSGTRPR